jgi:hypothetical protein
MSQLRVALIFSLLLGGAIIPAACTRETAAPVQAPVAPTPALGVGVAESQPVAEISAEAASPEPPATAESAPLPSAPESTLPAPPPTTAAPPPCVDGELMMGACICDNGKSADATGHCVLIPCPATVAGRVAFRVKNTGQCMECRSGFRPTADGKCEP